jgi:RNA polymerase primary sigma factor
VETPPRLAQYLKVSDRVRDRLTPEDLQLLDKLTPDLAEPIDSPLFRNRGAEKALFGATLKLKPCGPACFDEPAGEHPEEPLPQRVPTLTAEQEQRLFLQYNFVRGRMSELVEKAGSRAISLKAMRTLLAWGRVALRVRNRIVQLNMPLVLAMAKRTRLSGVDFNELISEGNMALLRSVGKFDCGRGFKFSTYACRAILKSFSRVAMRASRYHGRFPVEFDPTMERSDYLDKKREETEGSCIDEIRQILEENLAGLSGIEQQVIYERFAVCRTPGGEPVKPKTLEQVGAMVGVTKERIRQIQNKALKKIKSVLEDGVLAA